MDGIYIGCLGGLSPAVNVCGCAGVALDNNAAITSGRTSKKQQVLNDHSEGEPDETRARVCLVALYRIGREAAEALSLFVVSL